MGNIISQYYQGIVHQLRSEVDSINDLFHHQGVKGEGNEEVLRQLLIKFIPKRYAVGTGIVIDRNGTQSRQCDIVIYDALLYPSLLSLTNLHLFPVDIVYATIEIKTTLNSSSVKEALENIASVRNLDFVPTKFISLDTGLNRSQLINSSPPLGFIFAYNSEIRRFETFKRWCTPTHESDVTDFPSLVACLDQGILLWKKEQQVSVYPDMGMQLRGWLIPLMDGNYNTIQTDGSGRYGTYEQYIYPVKQFQENYFLIDQSKILLLFLLYLNEMLSKKKINPSMGLFSTYFKDPLNDRSLEMGFEL